METMMKKFGHVLIVIVSALILQCCSTDDPFGDYENSGVNYGNGGTMSVDGSSAGAVSSGSSEITSFDIAIDRETAEPATTVAAYYPDEEDNLSNNSFGTEVAIDMANPTAGTVSGVSISVNGGHITANHGSQKGISYVVTGSADNGSLTIVGEKKYKLTLNSVDITNPDSAALNLLSSKRAFVVLSGTSTLTDGTSSKNDHKGALYCKGKLLISGSGQLSVYGNYNNAIHTADYIVTDKGVNIYAKSTANHGIKANDGVFINGGVLNVEVSAAAAKGINCESNIMVNGGRTTVITTGTGDYDTDDKEAKGAAAIKCDSVFTQNGGEVLLKSTGNGGKGLRAGWEGYVNGGTLKVLTTGGTYSSNNDTASPKGIKTGRYPDEHASDERFWAAAELLLATGKAKYRKAAAKYPFLPT